MCKKKKWCIILCWVLKNGCGKHGIPCIKVEKNGADSMEFHAQERLFSSILFAPWAFQFGTFAFLWEQRASSRIIGGCSIVSLNGTCRYDRQSSTRISSFQDFQQVSFVFWQRQSKWLLKRKPHWYTLTHAHTKIEIDAQKRLASKNYSGMPSNTANLTIFKKWINK